MPSGAVKSEGAGRLEWIYFVTRVGYEPPVMFFASRVSGLFDRLPYHTQTVLLVVYDIFQASVLFSPAPTVPVFEAT